MSEPEEAPKNSKPKVLSDSEVDDLYARLKNQEESDDSSDNIISKFKKTGDSLMDKTVETGKSGDKFLTKGANDTIKKTTEFAGKIVQSKPVFEKFKKQSSNDINEFASKSTSKLKSFGDSLKSVSGKYVQKTKTELEESKNFLKNNAPTTKNKIKGEFEKGTDSLKKNVPKVGYQTKSSFMDSIEKMHGAAAKGKQYGAPSASILFQLGELKAAGLITMDEYNSKKKEILERI